MFSEDRGSRVFIRILPVIQMAVITTAVALRQPWHSRAVLVFQVRESRVDFWYVAVLDIDFSVEQQRRSCFSSQVSKHVFVVL